MSRSTFCSDGPLLRMGSRGPGHEHVLGVDHQGPELVEDVARVALLEEHLDGLLGSGEAQRLVEGAVDLLGLAGGLPLAIDGGEPARIKEAVGGLVADLEEVLAEVGLVDGARGVAGPRQRLEDEPVEAEALLGGVTGVEVVDAEGARSGGGGAGGHQQGEQEAHGAALYAQNEPEMEAEAPSGPAETPTPTGGGVFDGDRK
jgi:hypothetical protein